MIDDAAIGKVAALASEFRNSYDSELNRAAYVLYGLCTALCLRTVDDFVAGCKVAIDADRELIKANKREGCVDDVVEAGRPAQDDTGIFPLIPCGGRPQHDALIDGLCSLLLERKDDVTDVGVFNVAVQVFKLFHEHIEEGQP